MSKAEEAAFEAYPIMEVPDDTTLNLTTYDKNELPRHGFIKGYEQAEKDLALTWEDIYSIIYIYLGIIRDKYFRDAEPEVLCKEVLRKFNESKNK